MIATCFFEWLWKHVGDTLRWRWIYISTLWLYQHLKLCCTCLKANHQKKKSEVRLFYFSGKKNFGDRLNLDLLGHFGISHTSTDIACANLICIGSLLDELLITDSRTVSYQTPVHVIGAGFMIAQECQKERFNRPVLLHAVRGKLTLERCERMLGSKLPDMVLGDPGLLVRQIFPNVVKRSLYDVGIICHFHDAQSEILKNIRLQNKSVRMIDVFMPPQQFVQAVAECRFIFSSALHGIICADALNIPNKPMVISGLVEGWGYKFRDYYSVFDNDKYCPVDVRKNSIIDEDVDKFQAEYTDVSFQVDQICSALTDAFDQLKKLQ